MMLKAFILLENISKDFRWPCAIDLKMGTKPVGDKRVSKDKYERHLQRVNSSTSGKLGVRLCGMQVRIFMLTVKEISHKLLWGLFVVNL